MHPRRTVEVCCDHPMRHATRSNWWINSAACPTYLWSRSVAVMVGIELSGPGDLAGLLARMDAAPLDIERLQPGSAEFRYLI
jgi:hypothetical protein